MVHPYRKERIWANQRLALKSSKQRAVLPGVLITPPHLVTRADDKDSLHLRICSSTSRLFICKIERCDELCSIIRANREISRLWRVFCSCLSFSNDSTRVWRSKTEYHVKRQYDWLYLPCFRKSRIQLWFFIWFFGISISHDSQGMGRFGLNSHCAECSTRLSNRTIASQPCSAFSHLTLKNHTYWLKLINNSYRSFPRRFFIIRGIGFISRKSSGWRSEKLDQIVSLGVTNVTVWHLCDTYRVDNSDAGWAIR